MSWMVINITENVEARIYREADVTDQIVVKINYLQYTQPYGYISIFLSNKKTFHSDFDKEDRYYKMGVYNKGDVFSGGMYDFEKCKNVSCSNLGYYMKLEKTNDYITCWLSYDSDEWILISSNYLENYSNEQKFYMGIYLYLGENQYYNWLYTNYIQLYGRNVFSSEYFVDYFVTPEKDGNFNTVHSLLDYSIMDKSILMESGVDILQFIKTNINKGKYIEFILNEFYLEGTSAYKDYEFHHANIIYGYDEFGIYILGYGKEGYLQPRRFEYDVLLKSLDNDINHLCVYTFAPLDSYYKLNIHTIKKLLTEYWKGCNTNLGIEFLLPKGDRDTKTTIANDNDEAFSENLPEFLNVYGIHIYDIFLENDIMIDYFLKDYRISYIIYEHKKIMKDRVLYLHQRKHMRYENINDILESTDTLLHEAKTILNICLKHTIKQNSKNKIQIRAKIKKLKELEENYYPKLLNEIIS